MAEPGQEKPMDLGIFSRRSKGPQVTTTELVAGAASALWLLAVTLFFVFASGRGEGDGPKADVVRFVMTFVAIFLPVALIWVAAAAARSARVMREEAARLEAAVNAMRHSYLQQQQSGAAPLGPSFEKKLEEIAAAQRKTEEKLAMFTSIRPAAEEAEAERKAALPAGESAAEAQPSLALDTPDEPLAPPLSVADFIRALNFPDDPEDKEGFRALRRALQDRSAAQLVQAAQDVLTLLSQDGIYMDDLRPDRARPEIWRRFAKGERGKTVAMLGGIRDRSSLALAAGRMRQDPVFRDSVHHFLRRFDRTFSEFEKTATDEEINALADTRTARAFMLLGRVTGTFD